MKRVFLAKIELLRPMLEWVCSRLGSVDSKILKKIELACEEAFVNILRHGYQDQLGEIEVEVRASQSRIEIAMKDGGPPFDPLRERREKDWGAPAEEREIGGLGLHLIQQCMDEVRYERKGNANILRLIKKI